VCVIFEYRSICFCSSTISFKFPSFSCIHHNFLCYEMVWIQRLLIPNIQTICQFHSTGKCRFLLQNINFPLSSSSGFIFYDYCGIEQVGSRSNICNFCFRCAWFESQTGHQLPYLWLNELSSVPPGICQDVTLNQKMDGFFHILYYSLPYYQLTFYQSELLTAFQMQK